MNMPSDWKPYKLYRNITFSNMWNHMRFYIGVDFDAAVIPVYSAKIWYPSSSSVEMHYLVVFGYTSNLNGTGENALKVWDPENGSVHVLTKSLYDYATVAGMGVYPVWDDASL